MLLTSVSSDIAQANMKAMKESQSTNRPILRKTSSLAAPNFIDEIRLVVFSPRYPSRWYFYFTNYYL